MTETMNVRQLMELLLPRVREIVVEGLNGDKGQEVDIDLKKVNVLDYNQTLNGQAAILQLVLEAIYQSILDFETRRIGKAIESVISVSESLYNEIQRLNLDKRTEELFADNIYSKLVPNLKYSLSECLWMLKAAFLERRQFYTPMGGNPAERISRRPINILLSIAFEKYKKIEMKNATVNFEVTLSNLENFIEETLGSKVFVSTTVGSIQKSLLESKNLMDTEGKRYIFELRHSHIIFYRPLEAGQETPDEIFEESIYYKIVPFGDPQLLFTYITEELEKKQH